MERKEFISKLAVSLAAVCAGCSIASCGTTPKNEEPQPNNDNNSGNGGSPGSPIFSVNLDNELKNVGEFKVASGIILVRLSQGNASGAFTAVQVACTHEGTPINYNNAQGKFICPNHGSQFSNNGNVLLGPATMSLKQYNVAVNGTSLTVSA